VKNHNKILIVSGLDATGGAGIIADIQVATNLGVHSCAIVSTQTVQDTNKVHKIITVDDKLFSKQLETLNQDINITHLKIGMIGSIKIIQIIDKFIQNKTDKNLKIICDPVLFSGGNNKLIQSPAIIKAYLKYIVPHTYLLTPNQQELQQLTGENNEKNAIKKLQNIGCKNILITGGDEPNTKIISNKLYTEDKIKIWQNKKLTGKFHGTGCTLATAITCFLKKNNELIDSTQKALNYTQTTIKNAYQIAKSPSQFIPDRLQKNCR